MKERFQKAMLILLGVVAVVLLLLALLRPREPVYQGKTLSECFHPEFPKDIRSFEADFATISDGLATRSMPADRIG